MLIYFIYQNVLACFESCQFNLFIISISVAIFLDFQDWYLISAIFSCNQNNQIGVINWYWNLLCLITGTRCLVYPVYVMSKFVWVLNLVWVEIWPSRCSHKILLKHKTVWKLIFMWIPLTEILVLLSGTTSVFFACFSYYSPYCSPRWKLLDIPLSDMVFNNYRWHVEFLDHLWDMNIDFFCYTFSNY